MVYEEDIQLNSFVRKTAAPVFVPLCYVCLAWQAIKSDAPDIANVDEFTDYYFGTTRLQETISPCLWNVYHSNSTQTNNIMEGWHSKLKKAIDKDHQIFMRFFEYLRRSKLFLKYPLPSLHL